ncbi:hypothetical protein JNUCC64_09570 [Streptomyces sp. JNUCC 64]
MTTTLAVLDGLSVPLRALRLLSADHPALPAPTVSVSPVVPDRLELAFHTGRYGPPPMSAFETWREELGISPDTVTHRVLASGTWVLHAAGEYAGAQVELAAFADVSPDDVPSGDVGEAG